MSSEEKSVCNLQQSGACLSWVPGWYRINLYFLDKYYPLQNYHTVIKILGDDRPASLEKFPIEPISVRGTCDLEAQQ